MSKLVFLTSLLFLTCGGAAADSVLLDVSCKVVCSELVEVESEYGNDQEKKYQKSYIDFIGLTRQEVDNELNSRNSRLSKLCKHLVESKDCLYFKH